MATNRAPWAWTADSEDMLNSITLDNAVIARGKRHPSDLRALQGYRGFQPRCQGAQRHLQFKGGEMWQQMYKLMWGKGGGSSRARGGNNRKPPSLPFFLSNPQKNFWEDVSYEALDLMPRAPV